MDLHENIKLLRETRGLSQQELAALVGYTDRSSIAKIEAGQVDLSQSKIAAFAKALGVSPAYLMGWSEPAPMLRPAPLIAEDTVTFYPIGSIAAGFDKLAEERYDESDPVEIPRRYLGGRPQSDYFVLTVHGDSMYPGYLDGDKILVLRQPALNRSGEIGVILYESENATLKKVEFAPGEDWMRLVPTNPEYAPKLLKGSQLEQLRVLGIPRLLIREL